MRSERRFKDADRDHQAMLMISQDYDNKMNLLVLRSFSKLPCRQPPTIANGLHVHRHIQPKWALPIQDVARRPTFRVGRSEEHTSELQSLMRISYAVFCLKKKKKHSTKQTHT